MLVSRLAKLAAQPLKQRSLISVGATAARPGHVKDGQLAAGTRHCQ
jgi:hypothetical protein